MLRSPCVSPARSHTHDDTCTAAPDFLLNRGCDKTIRSVVTHRTLSCLTSISATLLFSRSVAFYSSAFQICHVDRQSCEDHIPSGCGLSAVRRHREALGMIGFIFPSSVYSDAV